MPRLHVLSLKLFQNLCSKCSFFIRRALSFPPPPPKKNKYKVFKSLLMLSQTLKLLNFFGFMPPVNDSKVKSIERCQQASSIIIITITNNNIFKFTILIHILRIILISALAALWPIVCNTRRSEITTLVS